MVKVVKCIIFIYYVNELVTFSNGKTSGNKILQYTILQKDLFLRDYTKNTKNPCTYSTMLERSILTGFLTLSCQVSSKKSYILKQTYR